MNLTTVLECVSIMGGIATLIALMLAPMFYLGAKIEKLKDRMDKNMNEFCKEIKDSHVRLCSIEERNKK